MQGDLFSATPQRKTKLGHSEISYERTASILTKTSGFMEGYDFSLNPYSGCSFGCTYCYAAFFVRDKQKMDSWGHWVNVKDNSLELLKKLRKRPLIDKTIYMSSVTDPYQPIEKELELTRSLLKEFLDYHQVRMVVQTRSQLAVRDIDLFKKFKIIQVNMTITTDNERIRRVFEPFCPSNKVRMKSIKEIHDSGVRSCITLTPLLPLEDPEQFSKDLLETGIEKYIIQPFHPSRGKFVAGTREEAKELLNEFKWSENEYKRVFEIIHKHIPEIGIGKEGFAPI